MTNPNYYTYLFANYTLTGNDIKVQRQFCSFVTHEAIVPLSLLRKPMQVQSTNTINFKTFETWNCLIVFVAILVFSFLFKQYVFAIITFLVVGYFWLRSKPIHGWDVLFRNGEFAFRINGTEEIKLKSFCERVEQLVENASAATNTFSNVDCESDSTYSWQGWIDSGVCTLESEKLIVTTRSFRSSQEKVVWLGNLMQSWWKFRYRSRLFYFVGTLTLLLSGTWIAGLATQAIEFSSISSVLVLVLVAVCVLATCRLSKLIDACCFLTSDSRNGFCLFAFRNESARCDRFANTIIEKANRENPERGTGRVAATD